MSRQKRVRQITYGLVLAVIGIVLMIAPKIPGLHWGGTIVIAVLALIQMMEKDTRQAIFLALLAIAFFFLFPMIKGFMYIIGLILLLVGLGLAIYTWIKST